MFAGNADLIDAPPSVIQQHVLRDTQPTPPPSNTDQTPNSGDDEPDLLYLDPDEISVASDSSMSSWPSMRAWEAGSTVTAHRKLGMCYITLNKHMHV